MIPYRHTVEITIVHLSETRKKPLYSTVSRQRSLIYGC